MRSLVTSARTAGAVAGLAMAAMLCQGWMTAAIARDLCLWAASGQRPAREAEVVLVTVGDEDLQRYRAREANYLDRRVYARAIDRLTAHGAGLVVFDILFDRRGPAGDPADALLAEAVRRSGRVLLARCFVEDPRTGKVTMLEPIEPLARAARALGFVNVSADPDGVIRKVKLLGLHEGTLVPHLAMATVLEKLSASPQPGPDAIVIRPPPPAPVRVVPVTPEAESFPDYARVPEVARIPLHELLEPGDQETVHRGLLRDKVVIVGSTSPLLKDRHPIVRHWLTGGASLDDGVWFVAAFIENTLGSSWLTSLGPALGAWPMAGLALLSVLLAVQTPRRALLTALLVALASCVGMIAAYAGGRLLDGVGLTAGVGVVWGSQALTRVLWEKRNLARLNRELSDEIARIRQDLEAAGLEGKEPSPASVPGYLDKAFVARFLPARYVDLVFLGQGGMGVVYRATNTDLGVKVALKVLSPLVQDNPVAVRRFVVEAQALARLSHPGIVRIVDIQHEPLSFFAMELVEGQPLDALITEGQGMDVAWALPVARRIADVLGYVHAQGIIHRDIKPGNVMLLADGSVKLLDFGLVHSEGANITRTGDVLGTPLYMPPEQFLGGKCSAATDVYSLGLVVCQLLCGEVPARRGYGHDPARPLLSARGVPEALIQVIEAALETEADMRPSNGSALAARLAALEEGIDQERTISLGRRRQ